MQPIAVGRALYTTARKRNPKRMKCSKSWRKFKKFFSANTNYQKSKLENCIL